MPVAMSRTVLTALAVAATVLAPGPAAADLCGLLTRAPPRIVPVSLADAPAPVLTLTFVGHSTFLIESPGGVRIATDYNDYVRPSVVPDVATMNRAHRTHYTDHPDARIAHVLRGWDPNGGVARHDLAVGDVRIRNVLTHIRDWGGSDSLRNANSIFVFEAAGLCVVHLGHLHHTLPEPLLAALGRVDVLLVPVDGNYTLDLDGMVEVLQAIKAPLMIPMHIFGFGTLQRFLERVGRLWPVERSPTATIELTRGGLPKDGKVLVLPGR